MTLLDCFLLGGWVFLLISNWRLKDRLLQQQSLLEQQDSAVLEAIGKVAAAAGEVEKAQQSHEELFRIRIRCSGCDFNEVVMHSDHARAVEQARLISQAHDEMHFPHPSRYLN